MFYVILQMINLNLKKDAVIIASTRSMKNIFRINNDHLAFLLSDYTDILEMLNEIFYAEDLALRCIYLKTFSPLYWEDVAYPLYYSFVKEKIFKSKKLYKKDD